MEIMWRQELKVDLMKSRAIDPSIGRHPSPEPSSPALILIVEDEVEIAEILMAYLHRGGLRAVHAQDGQEGLAKHQNLKPDLVLLDVQMPRLDGWQVLSEIRHRGDTPVIMLTALDHDVDKLTGLRIGADDYVVKPFNPAEVVARVQAVLRRMNTKPVESHRVLRVGAFQIDLDQHEATVEVGGQLFSLDLTLTEFKILTSLMRAPKRVFSRAELLVACLPEGDTLERTVDSHVSKLRKKLDMLGVENVPASIRGVGYRFGGDV
jgi:two-component system response regulator AdeR